jgi:hypothetical protein
MSEWPVTLYPHMLEGRERVKLFQPTNRNLLIIKKYKNGKN